MRKESLFHFHGAMNSQVLGIGECKGSASTKDGKGLMKQNKLVLGSRPPRCVNKCLNCKPCMATLVISPHHKDVHIHKATTKKAQRDEGYYLLSWKCKCGNKFFQP
ncbi:unnamed protein product [Lupinus luteus]|uniref:Epidermal patterning factor-like protein n=1 Tax=Lupinus luteus TaxID=3873 RepID=A0AAV1Y924_LUPLU